jgi:glycerophosphoryl diester phosphodiesterase
MPHCCRFFTGILIVGFIGAGCASIDPTDRARELATGLPAGPLKHRLAQCEVRRFDVAALSVSHRGAPLGYPEHTEEGYVAAARMGAATIECDVTFTKDLELVCRHSQCDLHRTTNVLTTPLAAKCSAPFRAATSDTPASAKCCASDFTLAEYRSLCGRRDMVDERAQSEAQYLAERPSPVVASPSACGTLLTHRESIALIDRLGRNFTPELKRPEVPMPFAAGFDQAAYASKMLNEYVVAGIDPARVFPQSFDRADIDYWIAEHPEFGSQAIYLDSRGRDPQFTPTLDDMRAIKASGINIVAPPIPMLLVVDANGELQPSEYARLAKAAGLDIITWTFESRLARIPDYVTDDAKTLEVLHALHTQVGVRGVFSDWPGTVTYYANCWEAGE